MRWNLWLLTKIVVDYVVLCLLWRILRVYGKYEKLWYSWKVLGIVVVVMKGCVVVGCDVLCGQVTPVLL